MKLGYSGLRKKPVKKVVLRFLEGNDVFVSLYAKIIRWIRFLLRQFLVSYNI